MAANLTATVLVSPKLKNELSLLRTKFAVPVSNLKQITARFEEELREGLAKPSQNIGMNVTWVQGFPSGYEQGSYLTIDLGGTNLRVCWITLRGNDHETEVVQHRYKLPERIKTGTVDDLWNMIAGSLENFIDEHSLRPPSGSSATLPLGFTFSYPVTQEAIDHGKLVTWTKGFDIAGVEGENVVAQLCATLKKRKLPVRLVALTNDTTGAMIASAYYDPDTFVGAIFGTGCNAAYMDTVGSIPKLKHSPLAKDLRDDTPMAINCEYGAFDNARRVLPLTEFDVDIDESSPRPGQQAFEKMSAGLYLGEIFRRVLVNLYEKKLLFDRGQNVVKMLSQYSIDTEFLACLENETVEQGQKRFRELLGIEATTEEVIVSIDLAEMIAERGARLCCCGVAAIAHMKGVRTGHVAADGSVVNKHPKFKARWAHAMSEILDWPAGRDGDPIILTGAEDGSGLGAAIIAAMTMMNNLKGKTEEVG